MTWRSISGTLLGIKIKRKLNKCFSQTFAFIFSAKQIYNFMLK